MTTEREENMRYTVETVGGDELEVHSTLSDATRNAVSRLEGDPELGTLHVYEIVRSPQGAEHVKTITHAPTATWDSEVVVLDPDEKIQPPSAAFICRPEDIDESGGLSDPKHERHHEVMSDVWDNRDKTGGRTF